jgi:UDP-N-acetylmuramate dehydrogenase
MTGKAGRRKKVNDDRLQVRKGDLVKDKVREQVELSRYTTYQVGGKAEYFIEVSGLDELREALRFSREKGMSFFLLGGGSNVLISDRGLKGLVIRNLCDAVTFENDMATAEAGISLASLIKAALRRSLGGLEFLAGIPGSLGGALYGNAGAYGKAIGDTLKGATIITPDGKEIEVEREYFSFSYRNSALKKTGDVILAATLELEPGLPGESENEMARIIEERKKKHPCGAGSCGCFFKNVASRGGESPRLGAGKLLEDSGAKEMVFGGASVSAKHANFIINPGNATAREIKTLAGLVKEKVYEKFNILLEEEVQIVGDFTQEESL